LFLSFLFSWHGLKHTKVSGAYCLGIFQNGNDLTTLLGGIIHLLACMSLTLTVVRVEFNSWRSIICRYIWQISLIFYHSWQELLSVTH
jgi:hypothetical protein